MTRKYWWLCWRVTERCNQMWISKWVDVSNIHVILVSKLYKPFCALFKQLCKNITYHFVSRCQNLVDRCCRIYASPARSCDCHTATPFLIIIIQAIEKGTGRFRETKNFSISFINLGLVVITIIITKQTWEHYAWNKSRLIKLDNSYELERRA